METIEVNMSDPVWGFQLGVRKLNIHDKKDCLGRYCCIHNPSDHPLKNAPLNWRADRGLMERLCTCGIGHPDPDDLSFKKDILRKDIKDETLHGCCGCCIEGGLSDEKESRKNDY